MSSFCRITKNPKTGEMEPAEWIDDYFGNRSYGIIFSDGEAYPQNKFKSNDVGIFCDPPKWSMFYRKEKEMPVSAETRKKMSKARKKWWKEKHQDLETLLHVNAKCVPEVKEPDLFKRINLFIRGIIKTITGL